MLMARASSKFAVINQKPTRQTCLPLMEMKRSRKFCTSLKAIRLKSSETRGTRSLEKEEALLGKKTKQTPLGTFKVLSYNVCFWDLELRERMEAIGDLIQLHSPDVVCLQEVTQEMYHIFKQSTWWWKAYRCSASYDFENVKPYFCMQLSKLTVKSYSCTPFSNSKMGRELCLTEIQVGGGRSKQLVIATSHLESPCPAPPTWTQMYSKERVAQAKEAMSILKGWPNVIFCGDINWDEKKDGPFPLPEGWVDAWTELKPGDSGYTYDTKSNQMISANWPLRMRLDPFVCNFQDFKICEIEMIGMEAIPGLSYRKEKKLRGQLQELMLPVLPSDHYGLLLTIMKLWSRLYNLSLDSLEGILFS
ncbi:uncharacterized protein LOC113362817 isoform X3 [Papaver somniferum]|uniref:uncharacterized protein LOC113362817 isoform X3 n=1 Tax=Papaver somniferum TaxID=3469 RepID=UPI000E6FEF9B|nr:uncharacterized protein LOC113362817 isoform X3 [Papaver somniferum]